MYYMYIIISKNKTLPDYLPAHACWLMFAGWEIGVGGRGWWMHMWVSYLILCPDFA